MAEEQDKDKNNIDQLTKQWGKERNDSFRYYLDPPFANKPFKNTQSHEFDNL